MVSVATTAVDPGYQVAKRVLEAEVWMVRYLGNVIGPISLRLVEKGIAAGKLPRGTEIAHWEEQQWRRLRDLYPELDAAPAVSILETVEAAATPRREPPTTMISDAPPVKDEAPSQVAIEAAAPEVSPGVTPEVTERPSSLPPPAPPRSARMPFSARAYSSPPPRPVPVPASAPPPVAPAMVTAPPVAGDDDLPMVPPPPPVPPAPPPSYRFPEEPVSIPKQGVFAALFG